MPLRTAVISDTVFVTPDGRTIVDVRKLLAKKHMQEAMSQIRAKTKIVSRKKARPLRDSVLRPQANQD